MFPTSKLVGTGIGSGTLLHAWIKNTDCAASREDLLFFEVDNKDVAHRYLVIISVYVHMSFMQFIHAEALCSWRLALDQWASRGRI